MSDDAARRGEHQVHGGQWRVLRVLDDDSEEAACLLKEAHFSAGHRYVLGCGGCGRRRQHEQQRAKAGVADAHAADHTVKPLRTTLAP